MAILSWSFISFIFQVSFDWTLSKCVDLHLYYSVWLQSLLNSHRFQVTVNNWLKNVLEYQTSSFCTHSSMCPDLLNVQKLEHLVLHLLHKQQDLWGVFSFWHPARLGGLFIMRLTPAPQTKVTAQHEREEINLLYFFIITCAQDQ